VVFYKEFMMARKPSPITARHRRRSVQLAGIAAMVVLSACQNPFPKVDESLPKVTGTPGARCTSVAAFSQRPHVEGDNGDQTEARLINAANPAGTLLLEYNRGNDAQVAMSSSCSWVAIAPTNGELWKVDTLSGEKVLVDKGRWIGVAIDDKGNVVASSLDTPWMLSYFNADGSSKTQTVGEPDVTFRTKHPVTREWVNKTVRTRMENGFVGGGAHVFLSEVSVSEKTGQEVARLTVHYRANGEVNGNGGGAGLDKKRLVELGGSRDCRRWSQSPAAEVGVCLNWAMAGPGQAVGISAQVKDRKGKVLAQVPDGLAALGIVPEITSDDHAVVPRADIWWLDGDHLAFLVTGRHSDDNWTPKDGTGIWSAEVWSGKWETKQLTNYGVQRWAAAS
jgi:hypothetical protein